MAASVGTGAPVVSWLTGAGAQDASKRQMTRYKANRFILIPPRVSVYQNPGGGARPLAQLAEIVTQVVLESRVEDRYNKMELL